MTKKVLLGALVGLVLLTLLILATVGTTAFDEPQQTPNPVLEYGPPPGE